MLDPFRYAPLIGEALLTSLVMGKFVWDRLKDGDYSTPYMVFIFIRDGAWAFTLGFGE